MRDDSAIGVIGRRGEQAAQLSAASAVLQRSLERLANLSDVRLLVSEVLTSRAATGEPTPRYVRVNMTIILLMSLTFLNAATGILHERSGPAFLAALTVFLTAVLVACLRALSIVLVPERTE